MKTRRHATIFAMFVLIVKAPFLFTFCMMASFSIITVPLFAEDANAEYEAGMEAYMSKNYETAVMHFRKAAEQGNAEARNNLGVCYSGGYGVEKNKKEAAKWFRMAAEQGNAKAQLNLGYCYAEGDSVEQNDVEAVKWWRMAAEQGNVFAQWALGQSYSDGKGVEQDDLAAAKWLRKAAEQGSISSFIDFEMYSWKREQDVSWNGAEQFYLAKIYETKSRNLYRESAEKGFAPAQYKLGLSLMESHEGKQWLRKAAEQGHKLALHILNDEKESIKWYRKAAEGNDSLAQLELGICYAEGKGVEKNTAESVKWYRKAAEQGNVEAQYRLGVCFSNGEGIEKNEVEAMKWYRKAAEAQLSPSADAQYLLGNCYAKGSGVERDMVNAVKWYLKAVENGSEDAKKALEQLK